MRDDFKDAHKGLRVSKEFASGLEGFKVHFVDFNRFVVLEAPNRR